MKARSLTLVQSRNGLPNIHNTKLRAPKVGANSANKFWRHTVSRCYQIRRRDRWVAVPIIRLSGKWLEAAGFLEGDRIEVWRGNGRIVIIKSSLSYSDR